MDESAPSDDSLRTLYSSHFAMPNPPGGDYRE